MKSFLERSPMITGVIALVTISVFTVGAIALDSGGLPSFLPGVTGTYRVEVEFADASGLRPGNTVTVAGVKSGEVSGVDLSPAGTVLVKADVNRGVELPRNAHAEIHVDTVLGSKSLVLRLPDPDAGRREPGPDWSLELREVGEIPIENTTTPFEAIDLQDVGTDLAVETDADALNRLISSLAEITDGARDDVTAVVENLNAVTSVVNERESEARDLLDAAAELSSTLADRDAELIRLIDELAVVVATLEDQKDELVALLNETAATSAELGDLLGDHRGDLDALLADLDRTLRIVDQHHLDLAAGLAYSASAIEGFSGIGYSGPNRTPHPWANIFLGGAGPAGVDAQFGACGMFDIALDVILGPDPRPCVDRDEPVTAAGAGGAVVADVSPEPDSSSAATIDWFLDAAGVSR